MITFQISAPGRITLSGEHTAMYGKQVVVASINIRTTLVFHELPSESRIIKIIFPDLALSLDISMETIMNFMSNENFNYVVQDYSLFLRHVQYFITLNGLWTTYEQRFSLQTFFFLLFFIGLKEELVIDSFQVYLVTQLPMKEGLGSSTSFATCLAACFLHWACLQKGDHNVFTAEELIRIGEYVMYSEEVIQNFVYHSDNNVCTLGRITTFGCTEMLNSHSNLIIAPEINILLVNANVHLNKSQQMKELATMKYNNGFIVDYYLNNIGNVSREIIESFRIPSDQQRNESLNLYATLETTFPLSQELLRNLNLSHANSDDICRIANNYGFKAKLAGAGTSFVIILLRPNISRDETSDLVRCLLDRGFVATMTTISCCGMKID